VNVLDPFAVLARWFFHYTCSSINTAEGRRGQTSMY